MVGRVEDERLHLAHPQEESLYHGAAPAGQYSRRGTALNIDSNPRRAKGGGSTPQKRCGKMF